MDVYQYNQYTVANQQEIENKKKADDLKLRLLSFANVKSLEEARQLAKSVIPTNLPYTSFYVGNAKCSVINKPDLFRVSVDTPDEFICYDFS